jgi:hypothetical protein
MPLLDHVSLPDICFRTVASFRVGPPLATQGQAQPECRKSTTAKARSLGLHRQICLTQTANASESNDQAEAPGGWYADFRDPDVQTISFFQPAEKPRTMP